MAIPFVLCADDYGLAPGVSAAILELIHAGRISATSCMTSARHWPQAAPALAEIAGRADIGLHVTLTDQPGLALGRPLPPLGRLMAQALGRRLDSGWVRAEIHAQLDAFTAATGRLPDFIDGHQHVHQLPVIRDVVAELFNGPLRGRGAWLRLCWENPASIARRGVAPARAGLIAALGWRLRAMAHRRGIAANDSFRGIHAFDGSRPYGEMFARFLTGPGQRVLVNCHPGRVDAELRAVDSLTDAREDELAFLAGPDLLHALERSGLRPARFRDIA